VFGVPPQSVWVFLRVLCRLFVVLLCFCLFVLFLRSLLSVSCLEKPPWRKDILLDKVTRIGHCGPAAVESGGCGGVAPFSSCECLRCLWPCSVCGFYAFFSVVFCYFVVFWSVCVVLFLRSLLSVSYLEKPPWRKDILLDKVTRPAAIVGERV